MNSFKIIGRSRRDSEIEVVDLNSLNAFFYKVPSDEEITDYKIGSVIELDREGLRYNLNPNKSIYRRSVETSHITRLEHKITTGLISLIKANLKRKV